MSLKTSPSVEAVHKTVEKYRGDKPRLLKELKRYVKEGQEKGDVLTVGAAYFYFADAYCSLCDLNSALKNALKSYALLKDTNEYGLIIRVHTILSYIYGSQDNHQMSLAECDRANRIIKQKRIKGRVRISVINNLANCYHALGDYKTSIKLLTECIELMKTEAPGNYESLAKYTINLAGNYKKDGDPRKSLEILNSMAEWIDKVEAAAIVCDYYLRRAEVFYKLNDKEQGDENVDRALSCVPENSYPVPLYSDFRVISSILVKNNDRARAERILNLMSVYEERCMDTAERIIALRMKADYFSGFDEPEKAAEYYKQLDALYEKRMSELTEIQMNIYKGMKEADGEIRRLKNKMQKNEELMMKEPLTKLLNRSALLKVASEFIEIASKKKQKVGAIFIDIDFFKECNDTYGHAKGDEIIKEVAQACKKEETANIRFARYGGDEFFGITRNLTDSEVTDIARRICRRIREADIPNEKSPHEKKLTLSAGVVNVSVNEKTDTIIEIANFADKAVYYAKNAGKNAIYLLDYNAKGKNASFVKADF